MLCGEELQQRAQEKGVVLPQTGVKEYLPDESNEQHEAIERFNAAYDRILEEERIVALGRCCIGQLCFESNHVEVVKIVGNIQSVFGYSRDRKYFLLPEEALFLVDEGSLDVFKDDMQLSVQEAYSIFLSPDFTLDDYTVYSHLIRKGYSLYRFQGPQRIEITCHHNTNDASSGQNKLRNSGGADEICDSGNARQESGTSPKNTATRTMLSSTDLVDFPDITSLNNLSLARAPDYLIPAAARSDDKYRRPVFTRDKLWSERQAKYGKKDSKPRVISSVPSDWWKSESRATTWSELHKERTWNSLRLKSPAAHLWRDDPKPLFDPQHVVSNADVLNKLKIVEKVPYCCCSSFCNVKDSPRFSIRYDVYKPGRRRRKKFVEKPDFRLTISTMNQNEPTLVEKANLSVIAGGVQVVMGLVDGANVSFFTFDDNTG